MKRFLKKALIVVVIVLVVFGIYWWTTGSYKKSLALALNIKTSWSDIEDQLNQRYDLVPALVDAPKKYAKDETALFNALTEEQKMYSKATGMKEKLEASHKLEGSIARLRQIAEKYPKVKTDSTFLKLNEDLAGTEKGIVYEEKKYNEKVRLFKKFKGSLIGPIFLKIAGLSNETYDEIGIFASMDNK